jgi:uncharacterized protein DUF6152
MRNPGGNIMRNAWLAVAPFAISLLPVLLWAHHGWAEFDETKEISLNGTVSDFHFVNPHCVIEFDVTGEKGVIGNWQGEFSSPGPMARKGWTAATLQPGDKILISGHPARNTARAIHATRIRLPNGQEFKLSDGR